MKIKTYDNQFIEFDLPPGIKTENLLAIPGIIDPHVHFRTPGAEYKENWETGARAAIAGGVTGVFDMPNNSPSVTDKEILAEKKEIIRQQLQKTGIPLRHYFYFGATAGNAGKIENVKNEIIGIKMFMGASTGDLLVDKYEDQEKIFKKAAELDLVVSVHAESDAIIKENQAKFSNPALADHSKIRSREAAVAAVMQAIGLAKKFGTKLYICHVSTKEEIELIKKAKSDGQKIYAEVAPHHLFLDESDYENLGTKAQMNPPVRTTKDREILWQALNDGTIDTIGTDHAPHTLEEKAKPYPLSPSGVTGIETMLPLMLNAHNQRKISLEKIVELTSTNIQKIFGFPESGDWTLINPNLEKEVKNENLKTKCKWSPFAGRILKGWPVGIILNNKFYN